MFGYLYALLAESCGVHALGKGLFADAHARRRLLAEAGVSGLRPIPVRTFSRGLRVKMLVKQLQQ